MLNTMHELSLAQSLIEQVQAAADAENAIGVTRVVVVIGPYSGVEKTAFEFAFPFAAEGTAAAGAELVIEDEPAAIVCSLCHATAAADPGRMICPRCGSDRVDISGGHAFLLRELELKMDGV
jgi:hydrogenase nickel incorporation protein HypA/HybF